MSSGMLFAHSKYDEMDKRARFNKRKIIMGVVS
jgi:hypothetical protein